MSDSRTAEPMASESGPSSRLLVFRIGDERFAVGLADVSEVIDAPAVRLVPDAAPWILGVATIAGRFVPMCDPRPLLGAGGRIDGAALLFMHEGRRVGVAVGDVFDATSVAPAEIRPAPVAGANEHFVTGIIRRGSEVIAVLDSRALLDAAMRVHVDERERTIP